MGSSGPDLPKLVTAAQVTKRAADFDTGLGNLPDGAFAGKADEGNLSRSWQDDITKVWYYVEPYFSTWTYDAPGDTYFSPNRQISSAVNFGSLLAPQTQMISAGWTTLLFCPNPAAGGSTAADHHGFANPPDHLLLDLFSMPVVEPYAISEPFSTDGKVNLNYQMVPFSYIERSTALRAALQSLRVTAIPNNFTRTNPNGGVTELKYKGMDNNENLRYLVNRDETLKGFKAVFDQYTTGRPDLGFFKSASQICEMFLYPKGTPVNYTQTISWSSNDSNIRKWWAQCLVTGDNLREKPYSDLYPRVTTKSNTYTVHYRVQSLRQRPFTGIPNSAAETAYYKTWDESRDQVLSEYRGSTTIERYLDPSDSRFYTQTGYNPDKDSLEKAYRFRTIYNKRFSPW
ncbi:MAG: Verru_Chthon cassette protein A, partial [Chthoniobacteraceae bacterium]